MAAGAKGMTMYKLNCCVAVAVAGLGGQAVAVIINVPGDQPTIQAGIVAAVNGDEVVVAVGEYFENINFLGKAITVRSTDPTDPVVVMHTIINGAGSGTVVTCISGEGSNTVLTGFVITGGLSGDGGGMFNSGSSPTLTNCSFSGNTALMLGGGLANFNGSSPTVTNCTFSGNTAANGGGMVNLFGSSPIVTNCSFSGNAAANNGGGMANANNSSPTVTDCTFSGNTADQGGGMLNVPGSLPTVTNTGFCSNTPDAINGDFTDGGGNSLLYCPPPIPRPDPCPWDFDGDGNIATSDLLELLGNWGPCP